MQRNSPVVCSWRCSTSCRCPPATNPPCVPIQHTLTSASYFEYRPLPLDGKGILYKLVRRSEQLTKDALTPVRNQQPSQYRQQQQQQPPTISCSAASSPHSSPQNIKIDKPAACTPAKRDLTEQQPSSGYACTACHAAMSTTQQ